MIKNKIIKVPLYNFEKKVFNKILQTGWERGYGKGGLYNSLIYFVKDKNSTYSMDLNVANNATSKKKLQDIITTSAKTFKVVINQLNAK